MDLARRSCCVMRYLQSTNNVLYVRTGLYVGYDLIACPAAPSRRAQSNGYCIFDNGPSQEILGPLLSAPSSATKTKIAQVVRKVVEAYHLLDSQGLIGDKSAPRRLFHRLICSQDLPESHVALLKYCHTEMSSQGIIGAHKAYLIFLQLLRAGQIVKALFRILSQEYRYRVIPQKALSCAFVYGVVKKGRC